MGLQPLDQQTTGGTSPLRLHAEPPAVLTVLTVHIQLYSDSKTIVMFSDETAVMSLIPDNDEKANLMER